MTSAREARPSDRSGTDSMAMAARGLRKSYQSGTAKCDVLRDVSLSVSRGECLFLMGPSGSGKTTLLSILGCVLSPDAGQLQILGHQIDAMSASELARFRCRHIGFVFQRFHLFRALTAEENVRIPLDLLKRPVAESRARAADLLDQVGLSSKGNTRIGQLSMGQRQRVAVARALAADPELILADEPTASLDAVAGLQAMELMSELCRRGGKTVIVVTHDDRITRFADRILTLRDGQTAESDASH